MISHGKAVEEVWAIRKEIGKETEGMSLLEKARRMHLHGKRVAEKLGLKYKIENKVLAH
jgi:hypothetical protein